MLRRLAKNFGGKTAWAIWRPKIARGRQAKGRGQNLNNPLEEYVQGIRTTEKHLEKNSRTRVPGPLHSVECLRLCCKIRGPQQKGRAQLEKGVRVQQLGGFESLDPLKDVPMCKEHLKNL